MPPGGPLGALVARLLWNRAVRSPAAAAAFLEPTLASGLRPPSALAGVEAAAMQAARMVATAERLRIGATASLDAVLAAALTAAWLRGLGVPTQVAIGDGHVTTTDVSLTHEALAVHPHPGSVLRVAAAPIADGPVRLGICGVAFYLLIAMRRVLRAGGHDPPDPREQLDVAALGGLASGNVLRDEERVLAAVGLRRLSETPRAGVQAVADSALIARLTAPAIVRRILPRLGAAIALGEGNLVVALLDAPPSADAATIAAEIEIAAARWASVHNRPATDDAPALEVDSDWPLAAVTPRVALALSRLEPHGPGNPEPVLVAHGARLDGARLAGDPTRPYWRLRLRQDGHTLRATAQHLRTDELAVGTVYDVAYTPRVGHVRGGDMLEVVVHDLHPSTPDSTGQVTKTTDDSGVS